MDERRLERALRQGPPFATRYVPTSLSLDEQLVARRAVSVGRLVLIVAVTALLMIGMLAGLAALGAFRDDERRPGAANGWVAVARSSVPSGLGERDISLVREGQTAHRIIGSDSDGRLPGDGEVVRPHLQLPGADESGLWFPFRVTWSPDGKELLYTAWGRDSIALIAVPIDPSSPPIVLHAGSDISVYDGDGAVPIQSWGSRVEEQP